MSYANWGRLVAEHFPAGDPASSSREWDALKQRFAIDQSVKGVVIAKAPFGAWLDIDAGFPALLEITVMEGLTPERYRCDNWCPIGSEITAYIAGFRDDGRQIHLWQTRSGHGNGEPGE